MVNYACAFSQSELGKYFEWIISAIFESVCNSQSSKAFELAAAYLQVKKGTKERNSD